MVTPVELKFHIRAYTKATMPLGRLGQYLAELAILLGERSSVHLDRLEDGSVVPVARIDPEAGPKVLERVHVVRSGNGPADAKRAKSKIERLLAEDNAEDAELIHVGGARILEFRGKEAASPTYGPIRQHGELTGVVIMVGGKNDPVPVHLEDGERTYLCEARRDVARKLAPLLFDTPIRASGYGRWFRNPRGEWEMEDFRINDFVPLDAAPLSSLISNLRQVRSAWLASPDPLADLRRLKED
ncbi:MAG: hypothetical protein AB7H88_00030 [Vicinamibacterales bacterium]